jgi:hypothetical protein
MAMISIWLYRFLGKACSSSWPFIREIIREVSAPLFNPHDSVAPNTKKLLLLGGGRLVIGKARLHLIGFDVSPL